MGGNWQTADYALIVSLVSLCFAVASFVWNIWSKFIFPKPKLKIWVDLIMAHSKSSHSASVRRNGTIAGDFPKEEMSLPAIVVNVTNYGPGNVVITSGIAKLPFWHPRRKDGHALLVAYNDYPEDLTATRTSSGGLPTKLEVGETFSLYYPADALLLSKREISAFGVRDSLSRLTWAKRENMRRVRSQSLGLNKHLSPK